MNPGVKAAEKTRAETGNATPSDSPAQDNCRDAGDDRAASRAIAVGTLRASRALILSPLGIDAQLISSALQTANIPATIVSTAGELLEAVAHEISRDERRLGLVIAADDALGVDWSLRLADVLDRQPPWSDIPLVLLAQSPSRGGDRRWVGSAHASAIGERLMQRGSVTVLDRPVRVATLVSAVRAALRARARQIEVAELIEARTRAQEDAEHAARVKSDFLAVMSHELRTPLNAIAGYADLLSTGCYGPVTPEQREALERINRAQRHLLGVINDVLNYSRLERGAIEYDIQPVSLADVVAEVGPLIEPLLTAKGLRYEPALPGADVIVLADREKLRQILLNLLSNAVKFTPAGGRITIEVARRADGTSRGDRVFLRVGDTGTGIPREKADSIFEPFVQVRSDPAARREGTGLGLAISRDLARGMGGDLRVRSDLGKGSAFTVELPRAA